MSVFQNVPTTTNAVSSRHDHILLHKNLDLEPWFNHVMATGQQSLLLSATNCISSHLITISILKFLSHFEIIFVILCRSLQSHCHAYHRIMLPSCCCGKVTESSISKEILQHLQSKCCPSCLLHCLSCAVLDSSLHDCNCDQSSEM